MKTLGQINYEAYVRAQCEPTGEAKDCWEAAAKAVATTVRAETFEECAKLCDEQESERGEQCAAAIRSLALE